MKDAYRYALDRVECTVNDRINKLYFGYASDELRKKYYYDVLMFRVKTILEKLSEKMKFC